MYAEERQQAIARQIVARGRMSVVAIAREYDVTTETVRRDLTALERLGVVRRVHGGAVPTAALTSLELGLVERDAANTEAKERIARAAVDLLPTPGASVLIDAGTTTARLAAALPRSHRLVVFTHAVPVASRLAGNPAVDLHLLPGRVRSTTQAAVGAATVAAIDALRVDVAFLGTNGVSIDHGLSTPDSEEAATKQALVRASQRVVALADSTKVGLESSVRFASLGQVDVLVTDSGLPRADRKAFESAGPEVLVA